MLLRPFLVQEAVLIEPLMVNIVPKTADVPGAPTAQPLTEGDVAALQGAADIATVTPAVAGSTGSTTIQTGPTQFLSGNVLGTTDPWATTNSRLCNILDARHRITNLKCGTSRFNLWGRGWPASTRS